MELPGVLTSVLPLWHLLPYTQIWCQLTPCDRTLWRDLVKMGLVPFHMWLPDAYEGALTTIGALLAGILKSGLRLAFVSLCWNVCPQRIGRLSLLSLLSLMTSKSGSLMRCSKNSCIFQYRTGRLRNDRIILLPRIRTGSCRIAISYNESCNEVCSVHCSHSIPATTAQVTV
jgi:hypothetical protein